MTKLNPAQPAKAPKPRIQGAMSKEQVNARYNPSVLIPNKIRDGLKALGEAACTPNDFARLCGISAQQLASYEAEFSSYTATVPDNGRRKTLWCGTTAFAAAIRDDFGR